MHRQTFTTVALTAAAIAAAAAPAGAAVADRGHFAGETYGVGYACSFPVEVAGEASGNYRCATARTARSSAPRSRDMRRTVLFDTGGDEEPGGEVVELLDLDLAGPHESFGNLCAIAEELTIDA